MFLTKFNGLTIENQIIGVATDQTVDSYNYPFDGTIGFAWSGDVSKTDPKSTILQNLKNQGQINKRYACVKLHQESEQPGGELLIGGCDVEAEHWGRVSGNGLWQIPLDKVEVIGTDGESRATVCGPGSVVPNCQAVLDTGAAVIGKNMTFSKINQQNEVSLNIEIVNIILKRRTNLSCRSNCIEAFDSWQI